MERGLTQAEVLKMVTTASKMDPSDTPNKLWKKQRNLITLRLLYETFARVGELVKVDLEDVEFEEDGGMIYIRHPKKKAIIKKGKVAEVREERRYAYFSQDTKNLVLQYLGAGSATRSQSQSSVVDEDLTKRRRTRRRDGPLLVSSCNTEKRITDRQVRNIISNIAKEAEIPMSVSPKSLREAGERHTDVEGADTDTTSVLAGHSRAVKEGHYKKTTTEDLKRVLQRHHPFFVKTRSN